jgi:hypothetical protein
MTPQRIQRKRVKGWRMPENTVSVCRPGKWGNPFRAAPEDGRWWVKDNEGNYWDTAYSDKYAATRTCIRLFEAWIEGKIGTGKLDIKELRGKNLACFCKEDEPCHADVLLRLAAE